MKSEQHERQTGQTSALETPCPGCDSTGMEVFYEVKQVPAHSVLLMETREQAVSYPRGDIALGFCPTCGFISNISFNPDLHEYSAKYEETQGFSGTFNAFHKALAEKLIDRFDIRNKDVIEIGCGKGEFLSLLCELGANRGIGFDPAYIAERNTSTVKDRIRFITDFYSEKYAEHQADFVCCKMTLEHIPDTARFISTVRRSMGDRYDTTVFFQIPDTLRVMKDIGFWDIYYEHCSYFSRGSLGRLFRRCGFDVKDLWTEYDDQYLMIEARPSSGVPTTAISAENDLDEMRDAVENFTREIQPTLAQWRSTIAEARSKGEKVVLWGGGSKGVAFLTTLQITDDIQYAVDINPHKSGTFMAGTGQEIVGPEFLRSYKPDLVIVMNPIYCKEIQRDLDRLGVTGRLLPV